MELETWAWVGIAFKPGNEVESIPMSNGDFIVGLFAEDGVGYMNFRMDSIYRLSFRFINENSNSLFHFFPT